MLTHPSQTDLTEVSEWLNAHGISHGPVVWNPVDGHCFRCFHPSVPWSFTVSIDQFDPEHYQSDVTFALLRRTQSRMTVYDYDLEAVVTRPICPLTHDLIAA